MYRELGRPVSRKERGMKRGAILLIEDRDDVRQGLAQLLELHGFLVADACSGEEALQQLTFDPDAYALILLDLMLPGAISGREVRLWQMSDARLSAIPTIVLSAADMDHDARVGLAPDAWLDKPYRFDDLLELVKRHVVSEGSSLQAAAT
jgi:two-component system cell cycle sensor histidine kinase/response regulator CckA